jgi:hypothetical protein
MNTGNPSAGRFVTLFFSRVVSFFKGRFEFLDSPRSTLFFGAQDQIQNPMLHPEFPNPKPLGFPALLHLNRSRLGLTMRSGQLKIAIELHACWNTFRGSVAEPLRRGRK